MSTPSPASGAPAVSSPMPGRHRTMDMARGFAVMGIVLMNIIAFAMPSAAYYNPDAWGGTSIPDRLVWALSFILIDGKMRGLFSLLFGASMLLLMDRTELAGGDGRRPHIIRCLWLGLFGIVHYLLLWWGDILALYAVVGLIAMLFAGKEPMQLVKLAFLSFTLHMAIVTALILDLKWSIGRATAAGDLARMGPMLDGIGRPGGAGIASELAIYHGNWAGMIAHKAADYIGWGISGLTYMSLDTLGFMLLGMAMLKSGFLTGRWDREQYLGTARHCFLIGIPPMIALAVWTWASGFDTVTTFGTNFAWSFPFRIPLTVGWTALIMAIIAHRTPGAFLSRVEAAGRMSLSNYLGTSLLMTALFYGWGFGLFGELSRATCYLIVPLVWALMLIWSPLWQARFRYGPVEWLWRSFTMGRLQRLRR